MKSVFFKYPELLQWFAQTKIGKDYLGIPQDVKDIVFLLPNGYIRGFGKQKQAIFYSKAEYSLKLYKALGILDTVSQWISDFGEAQKLFLGELGLIGRKEFLPLLLSIPHFITSTFTPDASDVDGIIQNFAAGTWASLHDAASGTSVSVQPTTVGVVRLRATSTNNQFDVFNRAILLFNTSALTSGAIITSAKLTLFVNTKPDSFTENIEIVSSTPASNNNLVVGDYSQLGTTSFSSNPISSLTTSANNDLVLNASGLSNISLTGVSKFGARFNGDRTNTPNTWISAGDTNPDCNFSGSPSNKPTLTVVYTRGSMTPNTKFWGT